MHVHFREALVQAARAMLMCSILLSCALAAAATAAAIAASREARASHLVEAVHGAALDDPGPDIRGHRGIAGQDTEHRGHVGVDHAGALGDGSEAHGVAADVQLEGAALADEVCPKHIKEQ